jgi:alkylation response protein AidB-like acyl-CoA dehydrogenase
VTLTEIPSQTGSGSGSEELEALAELAETVFGDVDVETTKSPAYSHEAVSDEHDRRLWRTLADTGLLAAVLPEAEGGGGTGIPGMVRLLIEAGAALARIPLVETLIAATNVAESGTDAQRERILPGVMAGELVITAALTEHPSLIAHPLTLADHKLTGITQFVPYPLSSDSVLVPARTPSGHEVLVLVSLSTARIGDQVPTTGEPLGILEFIDADVKDVVDAAPRARQLAALFASAELCGIGAKALAMTAEYVSGRLQFGHPLASFQAVALRAADRYIDSRAMQAACWEAARHAAGSDHASPRAGYAVAAAKIWAADGTRRIVGSAHHLHGGFGVDVTYPLHRYHAWARYWEMYGGSAAAWSADLGALIAAHPIEEDE